MPTNVIRVGGLEYTPAEVREWARIKQIAVNPRGRLSKNLVAAFVLDKRRSLKQAKTPTNLPAPPVRKVVSNKGVTHKKLSKVKKPGCPQHKVAMVFNEVKGMWKCPAEGCVISAWPKEGGTKPLIGTGKVTFYQEGTGKTGRLYLRSSNGVLIEITGVASRIDLENDGGGFGTVAHIELSLYME